MFRFTTYKCRIIKNIQFFFFQNMNDLCPCIIHHHKVLQMVTKVFLCSFKHPSIPIVIMYNRMHGIDRTQLRMREQCVSFGL